MNRTAIINYRIKNYVLLKCAALMNFTNRRKFTLQNMDQDSNLKLLLISRW